MDLQLSGTLQWPPLSRVCRKGPVNSCEGEDNREFKGDLL